MKSVSGVAVLPVCIVVVVACLLLFVVVVSPDFTTKKKKKNCCSGVRLWLSVCNSLLSRFFFPPFRNKPSPCLLAHRLPSMSPWRPSLPLRPRTTPSKNKQTFKRNKNPHRANKQKKKCHRPPPRPSRHCFSDVFSELT